MFPQSGLSWLQLLVTSEYLLPHRGLGLDRNISPLLIGYVDEMKFSVEWEYLRLLCPSPLVVTPLSVDLCFSVVAVVFVAVVSSAVSSSASPDKFSHEPPVGTHGFTHSNTGDRCVTQYEATIPADTKGTPNTPYKPRAHNHNLNTTPIANPPTGEMNC